MTVTEKFNSDIRKTMKFDRANNGGHYDGKRACAQMVGLLERFCPNAKNLARQIGDFWLDSYILHSSDVQNEPSEENIQKLIAFFAFLSGGDDSLLDALSSSDFENLRDFVDGEAENLDLESLQNMMSVILERGAL